MSLSERFQLSENIQAAKVILFFLFLTDLVFEHG